MIQSPEVTICEGGAYGIFVFMAESWKLVAHCSGDALGSNCLEARNNQVLKVGPGARCLSLRHWKCLGLVRAFTHLMCSR